MIQSLKVEITPVLYKDFTELRVELNMLSKQGGIDKYSARKQCPDDELTSFFDKIFDCAKQEILQFIKNKN